MVNVNINVVLMLSSAQDAIIYTRCLRMTVIRGNLVGTIPPLVIGGCVKWLLTTNEIALPKQYYLI